MTGALWIVGCGRMAGAMLSRWLATETLDPAQVTVIDPALPAIGGVRTCATMPPPDEPPPEILLLGVKPQALDAVTAMVGAAAGASTTLVSILAGTRVATLQARFGSAGGIARLMPSLPVAIGKGAVAVHAPTAPRAPLERLMAPLGLVEWIEDETLVDAVTALSGSGPAFVYRLVAALAAGGAAMGLDPAQALRLARATVEGAGAVAAADPAHPDALADRVASQGGSTRAGLDVLDEQGALERLVAAALEAARRRNAELAALSATD